MGKKKKKGKPYLCFKNYLNLI
uniref:Uncharacterized protein n=1 Tax=Rhizophora mucronata TaxID=61149 RepID=A0A2P2IQY6_RHIMU